MEIYATSIDCNPSAEASRQFFATVQYEMHWAAHGQTAAEVIHARVDAAKPQAGMTNWVGAKLCESAEDILSEFEYLFPASNRPPSPGETGVLPALELSENEQQCFDTLRSEDETNIEEVIRKSGLPSSAVSVALLSLEMKRVIKQLPGKLFIRNR